MAYSNAIVTVEVDNTDPKKLVFTVKVDQEPVHVGGKDGIEWVVDSDGWTFTQDRKGDSDGIDIKDPKKNFEDKKGKDRKKHKWDRVTKDNQTYRYTISVTNES